MVLIFAGPNGSGKSTITDMIVPVGEYINADVIKKALKISDLEAAQIAEKKRNQCIIKKIFKNSRTFLQTFCYLYSKIL